MNDGDVIYEFRQALMAADIVPPERILADGRVHRCDAAGRGGKGDAAYILHLDGRPAGGFVNWRGGEWQNWSASSSMDAETIQIIRKKIDEANRRRDRERRWLQQDAATRARQLWNLGIVAPHSYLERKGVGIWGCRVLSWAEYAPGQDSRHDGSLMVPMMDESFTIRSLQFISPNGSKKFLRGGKVSGCFYLLDQLFIDPKFHGEIAIAEGFATAATIREEMTDPASIVAAAFNCGNLKPVALTLHAKFPRARIIIYADDDYKTKGNPGLTKAKEAASAVGGRIRYPKWSFLRHGRPAGATDFNDFRAALRAERLI